MEKRNDKESFYGLGLAPGMLTRLEEVGFVTPTPIQRKAIPIAVTGEDVVGIAQTGTGKTLAFSLPMIQRIAATGQRGLVVLPTRELAIQVDDELQKFGKKSGLKTAVLIGGASMNKQKAAMRKHPHVIIATPGRLIDHLEQKIVSLSRVGILVLDEADRMLDMGFAPQLKKILAAVPSERQTMLFSATMPENIAKMARAYMKKPLRVEVAPAGTTAERVDQEVIMVPKARKMEVLERLLAEYKGTILVFSRTKHGAKKIARVVRKMGHAAAEIHGNRSQNQRQDALAGFKSGKYRILIATDIAARGIDVENIELVINYDLPDQLEDYVHRIGRTGRAGRAGRAISFAAPEQKKDIQAIERLIKTRLPVKHVSRQKPEDISPEAVAATQEKERNQREHDERRRVESKRRSRSGRSSSGGQSSRHGARQQNSHRSRRRHRPE